MTQKLLRIESETKEGLEMLIRKNILEAGIKINTISVLKELSGYEAWIVTEEELAMGMTE